MADYDEPTKDDLLRQRNTLFQAISWLGSDTSASTGGGQESHTARLLRTLYSTTRTVSTPGGVKKQVVTAISTSDAAKALGVSQRTVQRWIKGDHNPSKAIMQKLTTKARQAVTTKKGRAQVARRAKANQRIPSTGVKVQISAFQGPRNYYRDRTVAQTLSPEDYEGFRAAWAMGGDQAARDYLVAVMRDQYMDEWTISHISNLRIDGAGTADGRGGAGDPRASR